MHQFFDPTPGWITVGGVDHLMYVLALALVAFLLVTQRRWVRARSRQLRGAVLVASVLQQTTLYGMYAWTGWDWGESLPLHISRVSAILCVVYLATGSKRVMNVLFYFSLFAWISFSYPQEVWPFWNLFGWTFLVNHVITLLMPVLAWVTSDWRPSRPALWRAYGWMVVYSLVALSANAVTGGNYFYQRSMPVFGAVGQPWYYLGSLAAGLVLFWLGYGLSRLVPDHGLEVAPERDELMVPSSTA